MNSEYWEKKAKEAQATNEVTMIRFGGYGAAGSTSWSKGCRMEKWQLDRLKELIAQHEPQKTESKTKPAPEDFDDLC